MGQTLSSSSGSAPATHKGTYGSATKLSVLRSRSSFSRAGVSKKHATSISSDQFWKSQAAAAVQRVDFKTESLPNHGRRLRRVDSIRRQSWRETNYALNPDLHTPQDPGNLKKTEARTSEEEMITPEEMERSTSPVTALSDSGEESSSPPSADGDADPECISEHAAAPLAAQPAFLSAADKFEHTTSPATRMRTTPTKASPPKHYAPMVTEGDVSSESPRRLRRILSDAVGFSTEASPAPGQNGAAASRVDVTTGRGGGRLRIWRAGESHTADTAASATGNTKGRPLALLLVTLMMAAVLLSSFAPRSVRQQLRAVPYAVRVLSGAMAHLLV